MSSKADTILAGLRSTGFEEIDSVRESWIRSWVIEEDEYKAGVPILIEAGINWCKDDPGGAMELFRPGANRMPLHSPDKPLYLSFMNALFDAPVSASTAMLSEARDKINEYVQKDIYGLETK